MTTPDRPERASAPADPATGEPPDAAVGGDEALPPRGRRPASADDVRALRRWLWVAGAWAVAASVIALVALLEEDETGTPSPALGLSTRLAQVERQLERRIERLEERVGAAASADDVERLERRVRRAESNAASAQSAVRRASASLERLVERVEALEARSDDGGGGSGETGQEGDEADSPP